MQYLHISEYSSNPSLYDTQPSRDLTNLYSSCDQSLNNKVVGAYNRYKQDNQTLYMNNNPQANSALGIIDYNQNSYQQQIECQQKKNEQTTIQQLNDDIRIIKLMQKIKKNEYKYEQQISKMYMLLFLVVIGFVVFHFMSLQYFNSKNVKSFYLAKE